MRIVCLQHVPFEGPGAIASWASSRGHDLMRLHLYRSGFPHAAPHDAVVVMGGPMSVAAEWEHPWLAEEKRFLARTVENGFPVLGVCLGAQLLADALGGDVTKAPQREIGWFPVRLTDAGRGSAVGGVLPAEFEALHWHGDTFEPPPGAVLTATSDVCPSQSFELDGGRVLALQYHLEIEERGLERLIVECGAELDGGPHVQSAPELLVRPERYAAAHDLLFDLLDAWAAAGAGEL